MLVDSENRALLRLFSRYGLAVPEVERYASPRAACEAGVAAEIANAEIFGLLLGQAQREYILGVLRNLQQASQQRHLPAFQRCVQRRAAGGRGGGSGGGPD